MNEVIPEYEKLTINDEEEDGLVLEYGLLENQHTGYERCLVGSFLTSRKVNFGVMQDTLSAIWRPVKGVFME